MGINYLRTKQLGNKGEGFFETLISDYAIAHKVDGSKDIGLDFLCEWIFGQKPTQLMFGVQVKFRTNPKLIRRKEKGSKNLLYQFQSNFKIDNPRTLQYWKGFDFPVFLFLITTKDKKLSCYYKRYTPILHDISKEKDEKFYLVNEEQQFLAYKEEKRQDGGFCRDLFIDHLRCRYTKGVLTGVDPKDLGLKYYSKNTIYQDVVKDYKNQIMETYKLYKTILCIN